MNINLLLQYILKKLPPSANSVLSAIFFYIQTVRGKLVSAEPEFRQLENWISPGDVCIDVGANIGRYTFRMSNLVGPSGKVIALEPLQSSLFILTCIATLAKFKNIIPLSLAAGCTTSFLSLVRVPTEDSPTFIFNTNTKTKLSVTPKGADSAALVVKLDNLLGDVRVDFVKIDVEGHEMEVLNGMLGVLTRYSPKILVEENDPIAISRLLTAMNYEKVNTTVASRNSLYVKR